MALKDIQHKRRSGDYTFSGHAVKRMIKREILRRELEEAIYQGEIYRVTDELLEFAKDTFKPVKTVNVPNHGKLWKSLMRAHLGDYERLESRMKQAAHNNLLEING